MSHKGKPPNAVPAAGGEPWSAGRSAATSSAGSSASGSAPTARPPRSGRSPN